MSKRVLVSGGAGFIGSHVTVELIQAGYDVVVADDMSNCDMTCFEGVKEITGREDIPFIKMDFCDLEAVNKLFSEFQIDAVIHFAAFKAVGESVAELGKILHQQPYIIPERYRGCPHPRRMQRAVLLICNSLRRAGQASCNRGVPTSACNIPLRQHEADLRRHSPRFSESLRKIWHGSYPGVHKEGCIKGIALRYFNPIGAHPSALIGELPRGVPNNLVPFITQTAIGKRECLSIFGNDYPTPDGTCQRDYIDIVDLAKAHVYAVARMLDGKMEKDYEIFNIGTGRPVSVLELVNAFEKVNGVKLNYKFAPRRAGDVTAIWADPSLANKKLGWKAERTVEQTLEAAWAWEKHLAGK